MSKEKKFPMSKTDFSLFVAAAECKASGAVLVFMFILTLVSCKSVGGFYVRHGSGIINDTLHYRLTIPNNSNINLINP